MGEPEKIPSPYVPGSDKFDYDAHQENTSFPAMKEILKIAADNADKVVFSGKKTRVEIEDSYDVVAKLVVENLVKNNVPLVDYPEVFKYLVTVFQLLSDNITKQIRGHQREILSRAIGAKNPGNAKLDVDYANFADLLNALLKVRKDSGGDNNDYFTIDPSNNK